MYFYWKCLDHTIWNCKYFLSGYKYFGAARDLPGVRELFETDAPEQPKKTRAELMKDVDAAYYGFRDDDGEWKIR